MCSNVASLLDTFFFPFCLIFFCSPIAITLLIYFIGTTSCVAVAIYTCFSTYVSIYFSPDFLLFHWYYLMCCSSYPYMFQYICFHILQPWFFVQGTPPLRLPRIDKQAQAQSKKGIERRGKEFMLAFGWSKKTQGWWWWSQRNLEQVFG